MEYLIIPILNKKITLFQGPILYLNENIYFDKLSDDEHSAFFRFAEDDFKNTIDINKTKCIKFFSEEPITAESVKVLKVKIIFCLNIFTENNPLLTTWGGILTGEKNLKIKEIVEFEALAGVQKLSLKEFKIQIGLKRQFVIDTYKIINESLTKSPEVMFTLEKYNSALMRTEFFDKIVDTTICFETLTIGNTELTYRLSLNIAYISGDTADERLETFDRMKLLYDVRSKIVHGDLSGASILRKIELVRSSWNVYEKILKSSVFYFLIFIRQKSKGEWEDHLKGLILGTDNKII